MKNYLAHIKNLDIGNLKYIFFFEKKSKVAWLWVSFKFTLLLLVFGIPVLLLQRCISPLLLIRFAIFPTNYLGHMIYEYERYKSQLDKTAGHAIDFFCVQPRVANSFFLTKISFFIKIIPREIVIPVYLVNTAINARKYIVPMSQSFVLEDAADFYLQKPGLDFSDDEKSRGDKLLKQIGWNGHSQIVSFFLRNANYRKSFDSFVEVSKTNFRDVELDTYGEAIRFLSKKYFVRVVDSFPTSFPEANFDKDDIDFLNFYIVFRSEFVITTDSGSSLIPFILRVPNVQTNVSITSILYGIPGSLVLPLTYIDLDSGRKIPFTELIQRSVFELTEASELESANIGISRASSSDLFSLCQEIENGVPNFTFSKNDSTKDMILLISEFACMFPNLLFTKFAESWLEKNRWFVS
jgi:putative glycosyltransferase (TIGR04372 family)